MSVLYPHRRSIRLPGFDYGQDAAFFVSIVAEGRSRIFGFLDGGSVVLSLAGQIVNEEWLRTPAVRSGVYIDEWVVMPDHFQAILFIDQDRHRGLGDVGAHRCAPTETLHREPRSLGSIIAQFKATTTRRIRQLHEQPVIDVWQRGYHERIIRNEVELDKVRKYIRNNPKRG